MRSPMARLGWTGLLQLARVCVSVSTEGNSSRGLHSGGQGEGLRVTGLCVLGVCGLLGGLALL